MKSHEVTAYLGLGSNIGDRIKNLESALSELSKCSGIQVTSSSSFYETEPVGYKKQGWFLNQVIQIETTLSPSNLLKVAQGIEEYMGRKRTIRWGPRTMDIDILFYSDLIMESPDLTIPHNLLPERRFVLLPLAEIAPSLTHPVLGKSIRKILIDTPATDLVKRM